MQHLIVEVGILHVLQSGLSPESTPLSANGGILGKDARVSQKFLRRVSAFLTRYSLSHLAVLDLVTLAS